MSDPREAPSLVSNINTASRLGTLTPRVDCAPHSDTGRVISSHLASVVRRHPARRPRNDRSDRLEVKSELTRVPQWEPERCCGRVHAEPRLSRHQLKHPSRPGAAGGCRETFGE